MKYFPFLWVVCSFKIPLRPFNLIQTGPKFKEIKAPPRRDFEEASEPYWSINRKANNSSSYRPTDWSLTVNRRRGTIDRSVRGRPEEARGAVGGEHARPDPSVQQQEHVARDAHRRLHRHRHASIKSATFLQASSSSCMHAHIYIHLTTTHARALLWAPA